MLSKQRSVNFVVLAMKRTWSYALGKKTTSRIITIFAVLRLRIAIRIAVQRSTTEPDDYNNNNNNNNNNDQAKHKQKRNLKKY